MRLLGIENPPFDHHHIRQADTTSIAQFIQDNPTNFLWPKIGWAGADGGVVESELPLYAAITAMGWQIWPQAGPIWPRVLSIGFWIMGGIGILRWTKAELKGPRWPYLLLYSFAPLAIITSRNIQPDSMALALVLWGISFIDRPRIWTSRSVLGAILMGLGIAAKGQYFVLLPMIPILLYWRIEPNNNRWAQISLCTGISTVIPALWYTHAHFNLGANGASFGVFGAAAQKWGSIEMWLTGETWLVLLRVAIMQVLTPLGCGLLLVSVFHRHKSLKAYWLGFGLAFSSWLILTEGHLIHNYYQLPMIPFASILMGHGLQVLRHNRQSRWLIIGFPLLLISTLSGRQLIRSAITVDEKIVLQANEINQLLPLKEPIALLARHPQTVLFASGRNGAIGNHYFPSRQSDYAEMGLKYIVIHSEVMSNTENTLLNGFTPHGQWWIQKIEPAD
ncbi:MAG: ArnT family glycosyltransferase [Myxococcota bacterium]